MKLDVGWHEKICPFRYSNREIEALIRHKISVQTAIKHNHSHDRSIRPAIPRSPLSSPTSPELPDQRESNCCNKTHCRARAAATTMSHNYIRQRVWHTSIKSAGGNFPSSAALDERAQQDFGGQEIHEIHGAECLRERQPKEPKSTRKLRKRGHGRAAVATHVMDAETIRRARAPLVSADRRI